MYCIPPYTPLLYSKIGVCRGIHIFALKHRLWVLVRTASLRRFYRVPTHYVLSKNKKNVTFFHLKIQVFTALKYCSIWHGRVFVMMDVKLRTCTIENLDVNTKGQMRKVPVFGDNWRISESVLHKIVSFWARHLFIRTSLSIEL